MRPKHVVYVPSPSTIREMTADIRKSWSPREHRRRANHSDSRVELIQMPHLPVNTGHMNE